MTSAILVVWTIVGFTGGYAGVPFITQERKDWRPIGEFASVVKCEEAAKLLGVDANPKRFRCLPTGK